MVNFNLNPNSIQNGPHFNNKNLNYNAGIVSLEAFVEPYCPFTASTAQTFNILLNHSTLASFSNDDLQNINAVPGPVDGIYLKEKYIYRNNFAFENTGVDNLPVEEKRIPGSDQISMDDPEASWHDWEIVNHPMIFPKFEAEAEKDSPCANFPFWELKTRNYPSESFSENEEEGEDEDQNKRTDSEIYTPTQTAVYQKRQKGDIRNHGVHWKVDKKLPLFMGEDFFIEFFKESFETDMQNLLKDDQIESWRTSQNEYLFLNAAHDQNQDLVQGIPGRTFVPPPNQGLVTYDFEYENDDDGVRVTGATIDKKSQELFNMNIQPYYIIEIGSDNKNPTYNDNENINKATRYVIFIAFNTAPVFLKVAKPDNAKYPIGYNIGTWQVANGSELIKKDRFRITVRNHLGRMIITFGGYESQPWIIDVPEITTVPEAKISIWGGNISAGFIFSPLTYQEKYKLVLPPGGLCHCNGYQFSTPVGESNLGYEMSIGTVASAGIHNRISPGAPGIEISSGDMYSCDAQCLKEVKVRGSNISSNFVNNSDGPNFLGKKGGVNTQLKALEFVDNNGQYGVSSSIPKCSISSFGDFTSLSDNVAKKSAIGLTVQTRKRGDILDWFTNVNMAAGGHSHKFEGREWVLPACKTPILTTVKFSIRDVLTKLWNPINTRNRIDHRILSYNDTWSAQDYFKIDHTGSIQLYLNEYDNDPANNDNNFMKWEDIRKLQKRNFYISIDVVYKKCIEQDGGHDLPFQQIDRQRLFTGIGKGGNLKQEAGITTMDVDLVDYTTVLESKPFFNSPFFDGMRDINAVYEVLRIAGFDDGFENINNDQGVSPGPAFLVSQAALSDNEISSSYDGRRIFVQQYALPQSYDRLMNPYFKPNDGSPLYDVLYEFAKRANKMMFFDQYGVFHYENRPFDNNIFGTGGNQIVQPHWAWTAIPESNKAEAIHNYSGLPDIIKGSMLIFEEASIKYDVESCYNEFRILSTTPDNTPIIANNVDFNKFTGDFISRQNEQGWLGFRKTLYQAESIFGSETAVIKTLQNYSKIKNPPIKVNFSSYGLPVRALDIGILHMFKYNKNANSSAELFPFIITNVSSTIDPQKNIWWQTIEGEWIQ